MTKIITMLCVIQFFVACSTPPKIIRIGSPQSDLRPLQEYSKGKKQLVVIFVHGVGDHCPGYALGGTDEPDPPQPWIDGAAFRALGIRGHRSEWHDYATPIYVDGVGTSHSQVFLGALVTRVENLGTLGSTSVTGVEITWSMLTHRLKTKNLDYDLTKHDAKNNAHTGQDTGMRCFRKYEEQWSDQPNGDPQLPELNNDIGAPSRAALNRYIKEAVLDHELSDAILYVGPYRDIMQRAVAKGICDAITLTGGGGFIDTSDSACWVEAKQVLTPTSKDTEYVIFTHSLGSRVVYDVVRNLDQVNWYGDSPFSGADDSAYTPFKRFTCRLGAVYMMANQLPLIGLATGGTLVDALNDDPFMRSKMQSASIQSPREPSAKPTCDASLGNRTTPEFVAFVDTNDLLSWGIRPTMDTRYFDFMTVYVDNSSWHWFGAYESLMAAHVDYFQNRKIGEVIACGTDGDAQRKNCVLEPRP